ncbi:MAG TPA: hypothetical protein VMH04_10360 [Candidatus Solibacter sp.]|nr:hypothetical protein [Candidatus Solibacter sp.]
MTPVAQRHELEFKLGASEDAPIGTHILTGRLIFQTITDAGVSPVRQVQVQIPVTIVGRSQKAVRNRHYPSRTALDRTDGVGVFLRVISLPVLLPLMLLASIVCAATGQDCSC